MSKFDVILVFDDDSGKVSIVLCTFETVEPKIISTVDGSAVEVSSDVGDCMGDELKSVSGRRMYDEVVSVSVVEVLD